MNKYLKILDPSLLSDDQIKDIKYRFSLFKSRDIEDIREELSHQIRKDFDIAILTYYNIEHLYENIKNSFLFLFNLRTQK